MTEEHGREVEVYQPQSVTVFGTDDPVAIMQRVVAIATPLADFVRAKGMAKRLGRGEREYVQIEGWSFMGAMLGIAPITREVHEMRSPEGKLIGFEARVELVNRAGEVLGGGIGECSWDERNWADREPFALKSMAQTRATGKAFRLALGFVMSAAGFEATPAEEMPSDHDERPQQALPTQRGGNRPPQGAQASESSPAAAGDTPKGLRNAGQLFTWALSELKLRRADAMEKLGYTAVGEITNYDEAARRLWAITHPDAAVTEPPAETVDDVVRWAEATHGLSLQQLDAMLAAEGLTDPAIVTGQALREVIERALGAPPLEGEVV